MTLFAHGLKLCQVLTMPKLLTLTLSLLTLGAHASSWEELLLEAADSNVSIAADTTARFLLGGLLEPKLASEYRINLTLETENPERADVVWLDADAARSQQIAGALFGPIAPVLANYSLVDSNYHLATIQHSGYNLSGYPVPIGLQQLRFTRVQQEQLPADYEQLLAYMVVNPNGYYLDPSARAAMLAQALYRALEPHQVTLPILSVEPSLRAELRSYIELLHRANFNSISNQIRPTAHLNILWDQVATDSTAYQQGNFAHPTVGEAIFVGVRKDSNATAAAQVLINELLDPEVQRFMIDNAFFATSVLSSLQPEDMPPSLPMPHPDWLELLQQINADVRSRTN